MTLEVAHVLVPEDAVGLHPFGDVFDATGLELIDALPALLLFPNELRVAEHAKVSRDGGSADAKSRRELVHRRIAFSQTVENRSSRRISDCEKNIGCCSGSWHRVIGNRNVTYCQHLRI